MSATGSVNAIKRHKPMAVWLMADDVSEEERKSLLKRNPVRTQRWHSLGPSRDAPFQAKVILRTEPDLGLLSCFDPAPHWTVALGRSIAPNGLLIRPADGFLRVSQGNESAVCRRREAIIVPGDDVATFTFDDVSRVDCFAFSDPADADGTEQSRRVLRHIRHDNGALVVLGNFAAAVMRGLLPMNSTPLNDLALQYMNGLVSAMTDEAADSTVPESNRPVAVLTAIKAEIEARLEQRDLSVGYLARLQSVTARYIQKLFEAEGRTFSDYLLERRLERALHLLHDADAPTRPVSSIAFDVGFGDLSYFNRTFKHRFGATPREIRARHEALLREKGLA